MKGNYVVGRVDLYNHTVLLLLLAALITVFIIQNSSCTAARPASTIYTRSQLIVPFSSGLLLDGDVAKARESCSRVNGSLPNADVHEISNEPPLTCITQNCKNTQGNESKYHGRHLIAGTLGSTPPKCISKCSKCTPCNAVRVPIQPGRTKISLTEYYPEAWRCMCKNKLYMP